MHGLSHFHFRKSQKSPVWRHQLPGNESRWMTCNSWSLQLLRATTRRRVRFVGRGNFFIIRNNWTEHTNAKCTDPSRRSLCSGLFVGAVCQNSRPFAAVPSAGWTPLPPSLSCLALSHQRRRRLLLHFTLGITVLFWLFFVFSLSFPSWKDACCQGPTTSKWAFCLPAPGFWMQPAALWGLPDMLPFSFHGTGGKLSWGDDTVGNRSVLHSLERLQICSLSSPKVLLAPIPGWLKSWNVTKNWSKPKEHAWSGQNEMKHTPLQTTLG